jgi:hypothetical protein
MKRRSTRNLNKTPKSPEKECCIHILRDRATPPPKFSYGKKPITMAVSGLFTQCNCTPAERLAGAIHNYTELTGIVPFDWDYTSPVPEAYQSLMKRPDDKFCTFFFGFNTMGDARAVEAKFNAINRHVDIWTEEEERESLRIHFEQIEKKSKKSTKRLTYDGGDGRGEMYWRDHPFFQEGWRDYCEQVRRDRAVLPEKFSQPKRPITLRLPVMFTKGLGSTEEQLADAIRDFTEVIGIGPFNWEHQWPIPKVCQSQMRAPDDMLYVLCFAFDTMDKALAAKASLEAIDCHVGVITEEHEPQSLRQPPQTDREEEQRAPNL